MSEISAKLVKELREATGAGMMDCKKALSEVAGDFEAAIDWLRKKGIAAAGKKSGRIAAEGLTAVASNNDKTTAVAIELNSETDFVARNDKFQALVNLIANAALNANDLTALKQTKLANGRNIEEEVTENIAVIGENLNLRRFAKLSVTQGLVAHYIHNAAAENMGKIAVLVALESNIPAEKLATLGKQLAMHIAASKPIAVTNEQVDQSAIDREKDIFSEQAKASGKPIEIIEKMIEGRIRKFYQEVVLLEQTFVMDGKTSVKDVITNFEKENNGSVKITGFVHFELGAGLEKEENDFASEVAAMTK